MRGFILKQFTKSKIFYAAITAFIFGVGLASLNARIIFFCFLALVSLFFIIFKPRVLFLIMILGLAGGYYWLNHSVPENIAENINFYNEQNVIFEGIISEEVDLRSDHQKLTIEVQKVASRGVSGRVLVKIELFPSYEYGQKLRVECFLRQPGKIEDFDYGRYLSRYDIYSTCYNPDIEILASNQGNLIKNSLLKIKKFCLGKINKILPEPHASFMAGLLLGVRKGIPPDIMEAFNRTGVTHIIAVSGYNITIIAVALMNLLKSLSSSRKKSVYFACTGIIIFVFLCGASAAVLRAAVMGIVALLAKQAGRKTNVIYILILTIFIMLLMNPRILIFDVGFQLSFLATAGLIYLSKPIEKFLKFLPTFFGLRENFSTTMAAIISTTPLIMYNFGRISLIAPLANIMILSVIPIAMFWGFAGLVLSLISVTAAQIFSWLTWLILEYIIRVIEALSNLSWAALDVEFGLVSVAVTYCAVFTVIYLITRKARGRCALLSRDQSARASFSSGATI
ncbi:MAG: ComEC/Rec2 family competence protein [Patescibacteria group bacterium]